MRDALSADGFSGGYSDRRMPNGDYLVTIQVNGFTDRGTALEYLHRRAAELCPDGFDFVDRTSGDNGGLVVTRNYAGTTHKPEENALVRCQNPKRDRELEEVRRVAAREREERARPAPTTAPSPRGFFCAGSPTQQNVSMCSREKSACEQARGAALGLVADLTACTLIETASCFDAGSGRDDERCALTESACLEQRAAARTATPGALIGNCADQQ